MLNQEQERYALDIVVARLIEAVKEQEKKTGYLFWNYNVVVSHTSNPIPIGIEQKAVEGVLPGYRTYMKFKGLKC